MTYSEAVQYLYSSRPPFHIIGADAYKPGLDTTLRLMEHVGNPHRNLRAIHVAGTNGKGSTCHLIAAALQAAGYRVGLYTSPHLLSLTERIRINGEPIPEKEVAAFVTLHRPFLDALQPSFFETVTTLAFDYFVRQQVDIAVVEVGLGGRLDSTNVLTPILSVITNIGMDHTEFLGTTLPKIASEKAGIIKPSVPLVVGETHPQTMNVFLAKAQECGILGDGLETTNCRVWFADQCGYMRSRCAREVPSCELQGLYQRMNIQTAYVALQVLRNYASLAIPADAIAHGFAHVCALTGLKGRWQTLRTAPLIICDTGHNSHGLQYVARQLALLTNPDIYIVFGMVNDKDTDLVMTLLPDAQRFHYIFTEPATARARSAQQMLDMWARPAIAIPNPKEAIAYALSHAAPEDAIFIGGSNYLVSQALQIL